MRAAPARRFLPREAGVHATFLTPMLTLIRTPSRPLDAGLRSRLRTTRSALPRRYRADLDDMRLFFRLGGLKADPFR